MNVPFVDLKTQGQQLLPEYQTALASVAERAAYIIEDDVFIGPNVVFTDEPHPMNCPRYKEYKGGPVVQRLARIGANSTILPGVEIGENALVGAGSVVVDDVPPDTVVAHNPARAIKRVADLACHAGFYDRPYDWEPYRS